MTRVRPSWLAGAWLAAALAAQGGADPIATAEEALRAATAAQEAGDPELAAITLADATADLDRAGVATAAVRAQIDRLHKKIDPLLPKLRNARRVAARNLARRAELDLKNGWRRTARRLLEIAERLDPGAGGAALATLRGEVDDAGGGDGTTAVFGTPRHPLGEDGWALEGGVLRSPPLPERGLMALSEQPRPAEQELELELRTHGERSSCSVMVGHRPDGQYHFVDVFHDRGYSTLRLMYWDGIQAHDIAEDRFTLTKAERAGWLPLAIRTAGKRIEATVGDFAAVRGEARTGDFGGEVGVYVAPNSPSKAPIEVRVVGAR